MVQIPAKKQSAGVWVETLSAFCIPNGLRQKDKHIRSWLSKEGDARGHV